MIFFIVNSVARGGRGLLVMEDVAAQLRARGIPFGVRLTEYAGHATELAREAALSGAERIVALGGDGTVREVAAGILESGKRAALGIIPCGTGNDYRRTLNIPDSPMAALELVLACGTRMVDAAQVNGFTYCNIASVGFDTSVVEAARLVRSSEHRVLPGDLTVVVAGAPRKETWVDAAGWTPYVGGQVHTVVLDAGHGDLVRRPAADDVAAIIAGLVE